jgi:hypothetical protein
MCAATAPMSKPEKIATSRIPALHSNNTNKCTIVSMYKDVTYAQMHGEVYIYCVILCSLLDPLSLISQLFNNFQKNRFCELLSCIHTVEAGQQYRYRASNKKKTPKSNHTVGLSIFCFGICRAANYYIFLRPSLLPNFLHFFFTPSQKNYIALYASIVLKSCFLGQSDHEFFLLGLPLQQIVIPQNDKLLWENKNSHILLSKHSAK